MWFVSHLNTVSNPEHSFEPVQVTCARPGCHKHAIRQLYSKRGLGPPLGAATLGWGACETVGCILLKFGTGLS